MATATPDGLASIIEAHATELDPAITNLAGAPAAISTDLEIYEIARSSREVQEKARCPRWVVQFISPSAARCSRECHELSARENATKCAARQVDHDVTPSSNGQDPNPYP